VRKKIFAYFLNDHHSDGVVSVCAKAMPGDNVALASAQPDRFFLPAYIGPRGWVGLRLDVGEIDWDEVGELVALSYRRTAPKRLAGLVKIIFAPAMLAPDGSVTLPFSRLVDCAVANEVRNANPTKTQIARLTLCPHRMSNQRDRSRCTLPAC